jgi:hypothetical protein
MFTELDSHLTNSDDVASQVPHLFGEKDRVDVGENTSPAKWMLGRTPPRRSGCWGGHLPGEVDVGENTSPVNSFTSDISDRTMGCGFFVFTLRIKLCGRDANREGEGEGGEAH